MGKPESTAILRRLVQYLFYLKSLPDDTPSAISAPMLAQALNLGDVLVRKDLAKVSSRKNRKRYHDRDEMVAEIEDYLGLSHPLCAVYIGDAEHDPWKFRSWKDHITILCHGHIDDDQDSLNAVKQFCRDHQVRLGILDVSPEHLQTGSDILISAGVETIWNISPAPLYPREGMQVYNEILHSALILLSHHFRMDIVDCKNETNHL